MIAPMRTQEGKGMLMSRCILIQVSWWHRCLSSEEPTPRGNCLCWVWWGDANHGAEYCPEKNVSDCKPGPRTSLQVRQVWQFLYNHAEEGQGRKVPTWPRSMVSLFAHVPHVGGHTFWTFKCSVNGLCRKMTDSIARTIYRTIKYGGVYFRI